MIAHLMIEMKEEVEPREWTGHFDVQKKVVYTTRRIQGQNSTITLGISS